MDARELLTTRRTVRRFEQKPIAQSDLKDIVEVARYAPSGGNGQPWEVIAVDEPSVADQVFATLAWLPAEGPPPEDQKPVAYIVIISDEEAGVADCASLATYVSLAAHERGLGSCWFGSVRRTELAEDLEIPDRYSVEFVMALGYPARESIAYDCDETTDVSVEGDSVRVPKKTPDDIVHENVYGG
jgi:nitroreductase